ncbi:hypothetical protein FV242_12125 [Methylobacterium sp. WL64]|uniref:hypothetical protein n=1 Tax=Methylobacterium sp. WL64 TaxID=2603894 RepID=UPI0011C6EF9A|nr:hypothetical protein [Methylobacterium sp. WL64]TXN03226.1 hypothetical protein FV242_12125 [Methylobacterium sp. WL64]
MDDPTPIATTVEACGQDHARYRWHLTDADGVSVRVAPEAYDTAEDAEVAGQAALEAFGSASNLRTS